MTMDKTEQLMALDRRSFLALDINLDKRRNAHDVYVILGQVAAGNGDCLDRLIHRTGTNRLHLCRLSLADHAGNCTGDGCRARTGRNL